MAPPPAFHAPPPAPHVDAKTQAFINALGMKVNH
jgi:hypothetical protein